MLQIAVGSVVAGRYRLESPLARGGMGSVWVARHLQLDSQVAVKFMTPALAASEDARARFAREAKAAAQLQSPHVVQVHDYGIEQGLPFIVMELLHGEDLGKRLKREGPIPAASVADLLTQASRALRRAHEAGIVHRDLKPSNIFLAHNDEHDIVKLLDFGIAKSIHAEAGEATRTGLLVGSPHYMSPEQARSSKSVDHRADLWSMAIIVYRSLTGRLPFPGDEIGDVIVRICTEPAPPPSAFIALPPAVDRFFERALAKRVDERFQSARELAAAFTAVVGARGGDVTGSQPGLGDLGPADLAATSVRTPGPGGFVPSRHTRPIEVSAVRASMASATPPSIPSMPSFQGTPAAAYSMPYPSAAPPPPQGHSDSAPGTPSAGHWQSPPSVQAWAAQQGDSGVSLVPGRPSAPSLEPSAGLEGAPPTRVPAEAAGRRRLGILVSAGVVTGAVLLLGAASLRHRGAAAAQPPPAATGPEVAVGPTAAPPAPAATAASPVAAATAVEPAATATAVEPAATATAEPGPAGSAAAAPAPIDVPAAAPAATGVPAADPPATAAAAAASASEKKKPPATSKSTPPAGPRKNAVLGF